MHLPRTPSFRLDGRRALVTGASSGIGLGCAVALAEQGAQVVLAARSADKLGRGGAAIGPRASRPRRWRSTSPTSRPPPRQSRRTARSTSWSTAPASPATPPRSRPRPRISTPSPASTSAAPISSPGRGARPDRRRQARLADQHLLPDGPCRRRRPRRLLRHQARGRGLHQGDGDRVGPARHPRQHHLPHLHPHAADRGRPSPIPSARGWIEEKIKLGRVGRVEDIMGAVAFLPPTRRRW